MRELGVLLLLNIAACKSEGVGMTPDLAGLPAGRLVVDVGNAPSQGPANAPVTIVEFADFECPYCGAQAPVIAQILRDYGARVRYAFKQFPWYFHTHAYRAAEASLAANAQGKFWPYHDLLFAHQAALELANLDAYAMQLGLDMKMFDAAMDARTFAPAVDADLAQGHALGVDGTPAIFLNGIKREGALPYDVLAAEIDKELSRLAVSPPVHPDMASPTDGAPVDLP